SVSLDLCAHPAAAGFGPSLGMEPRRAHERGDDAQRRAQRNEHRARGGGAHSGTSTACALPSNALTYQPGFRLGYGSNQRTHEVTLDGGALVIGEEGSTVSLVVGSARYPHQ